MDTDAFAGITGLSERGALAAGDEDGASDRDDADDADDADGADSGGSGAFDEAAVDSLTEEAASAAVPF